MTPDEFIAMVAGMNTSTECPDCLEQVDSTGVCQECGGESDLADIDHLREVLDTLICRARRAAGSTTHPS